MNQRTSEKRTLKTDILRAKDFVVDHKYQFMGGAAIGIAITGGIVHAEHTPYSSPTSSTSEKAAHAPTIAELEKAATTPASPDEIIGTPLIDNGINSGRIYDQAHAELKQLGLDNPVNFNAVDVTSEHISSQNLIHPDSVFYLVDKKFKGGYDEVIVEVAPPQLETK
jgi:hypothetical protein